MVTTNQADRDIMSRLGFDVLSHLEAMRSEGIEIRDIEIRDCTQASSVAMRVWEDSNFPYRLPADLRAFLSATNGFSLAWATGQSPQHSGGGNAGGGDVVVGRISVNPLSSIKRVPLDADDLRDMACSRARATAAARARSLPRHRPFPGSSVSPGEENESNTQGNHVSEVGGDGGQALRGTAASASAGASISSSSDGVGMNSCSGGEYGIAAFCLDSACEVGRVAMVFGGAPIVGYRNSYHRSESTHNGRDRDRSSEGQRPLAAQELSNPEIWLQDLSCRWHFLTDNFTSYFRMMVVHLGILGWQQAFTPVGLSPNTEQCMRLYCPDRLLFDQLEWKTERANTLQAKRQEGTADTGRDQGVKTS